MPRICRIASHCCNRAAPAARASRRNKRCNIPSENRPLCRPVFYYDAPLSRCLRCDSTQILRQNTSFTHGDATMALTIGLMSGTSLDGVDGALAEFSGDAITTQAAAYVPFPPALRAELMALQASGPDEIEREALAANQLAQHYAQCVAA